MSPSEEISNPRPTDGSPFHTVSDTEVTTGDRIKVVFDEYLTVPAKIMWEDYRARVGGFIVLLYLLAGTVGVALIPVPQPGQGTPLMPPFQSLALPLGTDGLGRGTFAQLIHATPPMLQIVLGGAVFATGLAVVWGTFAGYVGGTLDQAMMTIADIIIAIPGLPLVIVVVAIVSPESPLLIGVLLSVGAWAGFARSLRSQVLTIRRESYVEASRAMGMARASVITRDVLPNLMPLILLNFVSQARRVIIASVGLYFIGVLPFSTINWGVMMQLAYSTGNAFYNLDAAYWFVFPMATIVVFSLGLILLGQGMDRVFNPRLRARHEKTASDTETDASEATPMADGGGR